MSIAGLGVRLFAVATSVGLCATSAWGAGPEPGVNVNIVNSPSNPVPVTVTGSTPITGDVAVTNTPTVKIAGQPYAVQVNGDCNTTFCFFTFPAVPSGKTLVINHMNIVVRPTEPTTVVELAQLTMSSTDSTGIFMNFGMSQIGRAGASNIFNTYAADVQLLAFVFAGQAPRIETGNQNTGAISVAQARLTGYLVDAQ